MKRSNKLLALALGACLFETTPSFAAVESTESQQARLEEAIQKVNSQTEALRAEIKQLKAELAEVKKEKRVSRHRSEKARVTPPAAETSTAEIAPRKNYTPYSLLSIPQLNMMPVITGPLPAGSADLDPSAFISFQNGMSQGLFYLQQQKALETKLGDIPPPYAERPQLTLSGKLEALGSIQSPASGPTNSSIDLVTAELEAFAQVSQWASGFLAITYNNALLDPVLNGSGNPTNNSNFFLNRGFLTIGNLKKSPIFFSAGQMYAPFGDYVSNMLTNPLTKVLGRSVTRAAQLGFAKDDFDASVYAFDGAANIGNNMVNKWGANAHYKLHLGKTLVALGGGFINDISDSQGAQLTGAPLNSGLFGGFSQTPATETLMHYVPGADLSLLIARGPFYFATEGITGTRPYDPRDMSFNGRGAEPKAAHFEVGYNFNTFGKKSIFNVAYGRTWDALAIALPQESYIATYSISIWKNTVQIFEFRHDVNYAATDTSTGACSFTDPQGRVFTTCPGPLDGSGGSTNTFLVNFGVYF